MEYYIQDGTGEIELQTLKKYINKWENSMPKQDNQFATIATLKNIFED